MDRSISRSVVRKTSKMRADLGVNAVGDGGKGKPSAVSSSVELITCLLLFQGVAWLQILTGEGSDYSRCIANFGILCSVQLYILIVNNIV